MYHRLQLLLILLAVSACPAAERSITLKALTPEARRYERIEFVVDADITAANPYDPAEVDLSVEFTAPSGRKTHLPAFFYQPHERQRLPQGRRQAEWLYPAGASSWRVRFAPTEAGSYSAIAILKNKDGEARSRPIFFRAAASDHKGYLRVSPRDRRYLEYEDGTPFFAVGQNVAFVTDSYLTGDMIQKLGQAGGNYARVWACSEDWAMAIESRKSAWGRSWAWKPPFAPLPGQEAAAPLCLKLSGDAGAVISANPSHPVALKPGTKYRFTAAIHADPGVSVTFTLGGPQKVDGTGEWRPVSAEFTAAANQWRLGQLPFHLTTKGTAYLKDLSLKEAAGGPELLWEADPNRPILGVYNQTDCFMLDRVIEAAEQAGVKLQVVLLTRDLYMRDLGQDPAAYDRAIATGKKLLRYAVARWGCSTSVAAWEYVNEMDPGKPTDRFYDELSAELERIDPFRHIRCTSAWHTPARKDYRHPRLDTADLHYYLRPSTGELYKDEVASVLERWKTCSAVVQNRPLMFSEFGIADERWQRSRDLDKDTQFIHLHNALWASAMSGFASTVCHWYWADIHQRDLYGVYGGISRFTATVPWTSDELRPAGVKPSGGIRIVGLQGKTGAYLWINDPRATWWNIAVNGEKAQPVEGASLSIEGLPSGEHRVEWWNTIEGKVISEQAMKAGQPLIIPRFTGDIACRIIHRPD